MLSLQGGAFEASLLVGDTRSPAPLEWLLAEVTVRHPPLDDGSQPAGPPPRTQQLLFAPQPEIVHQHRPPSKRAPAPVALAFALACGAGPLGLLLVLLLRVGGNAKVRGPEGGGTGG